MARQFLRHFTKKILFAVNILIAVLFVLGSNVKDVNQPHWWFFGLITFILPYLLLALIFFVILWLFTKPLWVIVPLLTVLV
ncbi:MAG: hypothetical protein M3Z92_12735, partial [Bacteroidota bacterium]|nr:hypothetical protein [Bacteroidota bacterium]